MHFSRGLPTGHISGPDYCLRPTDGPLGGGWVNNGAKQMNETAQQETQYEVKNEGQSISVFVLSNNHVSSLI